MKGSVLTRRFTCLRFGFALLGAGQLLASDGPPAISRGATREEVVAAFGRPSGQSKLGHIEILHFGERQVRLENGRVERISLVRSAAPRPPVPAEPTPAPTVVEPPPVQSPASAAPDGPASLADVWMTDFAHATREAARRNSVVLALFTSSDASPASRQFHQQVTLHPEFVNAFRTQYVMLHVDFPARAELGSELSAQNAALRDRYGVDVLPVLLILSADGEEVASVEIGSAPPGSVFRARLIAAVAAAYTLPAVDLPAPPAVEEAPKPVSPPPALHAAPVEIKTGLTTARWLITVALVAGTLLAGVMMFFLWLLIRRVNKPAAVYRPTNMAARISQAASGLPTSAEIGAWSKDTLRHVVRRLAETDGFIVEVQPGGGQKDLILKDPGTLAPEILVSCHTGNAGVIPLRRIREMVGVMAAEEVSAGWIVAPMGFAIDARTYAEQNNIRLLDALVLLNQLADLPTFALPKVLPPMMVNAPAV